MDHRIKQWARLRSDSDWERLGYFDQPPPGPNTLTNEIHPVFHYVDAQNHIRWPFFTRHSYEQLKPVLRLASSLLESPASMAFLHALLYSPRAKDHEFSPRIGYPIYEIQPSTLPLPEGEHPGEALRRLAKHVRWHTHHSVESLAGICSHTEAIGAPCVIADDINDNVTNRTMERRHGYSSTIRIRGDVIMDLIQNMRTDPASLACLSQQVWVANLLCHELLHAFNAAVDSEHVYAVHRALQMYCLRQENAELTGLPVSDQPLRPISSEPFLADQRVAEVGYCWENEVFGGQLLHPGDASGDFLAPLLVLKWPHQDAGMNLVSLLNQERIPRPARRGAKKSQTTYIVPAAYVVDVTHRGFWEGAGAAGALAARIPKVLGVRSWAGPEVRLDRDWYDDESSEGEYEADENKVVYRGDGWGESVAEGMGEEVEGMAEEIVEERVEEVVEGMMQRMAVEGMVERMAEEMVEEIVEEMVEELVEELVEEIQEERRPE